MGLRLFAQALDLRQGLLGLAGPSAWVRAFSTMPA
jgi:hypothetical protein